MYIYSNYHYSFKVLFFVSLASSQDCLHILEAFGEHTKALLERLGARTARTR